MRRKGVVNHKNSFGCYELLVFGMNIQYVYEINCTLGFIFIDPRKQTIQRMSDSKAANHMRELGECAELFSISDKRTPKSQFNSLLI